MMKFSNTKARPYNITVTPVPNIENTEEEEEELEELDFQRESALYDDKSYYSYQDGDTNELENDDLDTEKQIILGRFSERPRLNYYRISPQLDEINKLGDNYKTLSKSYSNQMARIDNDMQYLQNEIEQLIQYASVVEIRWMNKTVDMLNMIRQVQFEYDTLGKPKMINLSRQIFELDKDYTPKKYNVRKGYWLDHNLDKIKSIEEIENPDPRNIPFYYKYLDLAEKNKQLGPPLIRNLEKNNPPVVIKKRKISKLF